MTTRKIRVLVVDDAVAVRRLVSQVLSEDPAIEVVGSAATGRIALSKIPQCEPDVVTLDIEMPDMDGLTALVEIRKTNPALAVIMLSSFTERGAVATLEALAKGATDYLPKPAKTISVTETLEYLRRELLPRVKVLGEKATVGKVVSPSKAPPAPRPRPVVAAVPRLLSPSRVEILAVGVSTGGPNALARVLADLPRELPVPIVIVQHMPPVFTAMLAERLRRVTSHDVREATAGAPVIPGRVWLAPGDHHMVVQNCEHGVCIGLHQGMPENSCRPSVDVLFRSVATVYGAHSLALVMTGMGQDGLIGCEAIRGADGQVVVQDEASSVVWGMPGYIANAGLADAILPLDQLGSEVSRRLFEGRHAGLAGAASQPHGAEQGGSNTP